MRYCTCSHPLEEHAPYGSQPCWFHVGRGRACLCTGFEVQQ